MTKALLDKYVMKRSGSLPYEIQGEKSSENESEGIDILGLESPDADGTVWCDQSKYIHCLRENGFFGADGSVPLRTCTLPSIDEKLGEEEGTSSRMS